MAWDIRKGDRLPTAMRGVFKAFEYIEEQKTPELMDDIRKWLDENEVELSDSAIKSGLQQLAKQGLLRVKHGGYMRANTYSLTTGGKEWWEAHKWEPWGYGKGWEVSDEYDSPEQKRIRKMFTHLDSSPKKVIKFKPGTLTPEIVKALNSKRTLVVRMEEIDRWEEE